jgi:hypothetical protein
MESGQQKTSIKPKRIRFSTSKILLAVLVISILVVASIYVLSRNNLTPQTTGKIITVDFDSGEPLLAEGQNLPLDQTVEGVTAYFSSTSDNSSGSAFSIQSYDTTFITLSQFSGKYIYDNKPTKDILEIKFSQPLKSISLTFATIEYQTGSSNILLAAYMDSADSTPVGSASASGTILNSLYPQGSLSFISNNQPFNVVRIVMSPQASIESTNFFVDDIKLSLFD